MAAGIHVLSGTCDRISPRGVTCYPDVSMIRLFYSRPITVVKSLNIPKFVHGMTVLPTNLNKVQPPDNSVYGVGKTVKYGWNS